MSTMLLWWQDVCIVFFFSFSSYSVPVRCLINSFFSLSFVSKKQLLLFCHFHENINVLIVLVEWLKKTPQYVLGHFGLDNRVLDNFSEGVLIGRACRL